MALAAKPNNLNGAGTISALFGVTIFVVLLGMACQILLGLYATSIVTTAGWDAARQVAQGSSYGSSEMAVAESTARSRLGSIEDNTHFDWDASTSERVVLNIRATRPFFLPHALRQALPSSDISRTISIQREDVN